MVRVSDPDVAFRVVRALEQMRTVFYVQRAVNHDGRDVRVFVVGGRTLGAIERRTSDGGWRTNVSRGGSARPFDLPPAWEQLALRAAAAIGADYAGIDLLPSREGPVFVLEVNGIPGWQGLQQATGLDVAGALVEHLAYISGFRALRFSPALFAAAAVVALASSSIVLPGVLRAVRATKPRLATPVMVYTAVFIVMVASAGGSGSGFAFGGSLLFLYSDCLLAWNRFVSPVRYGRLANIVVYHIGQALLVISLAT